MATNFSAMLIWLVRVAKLKLEPSQIKASAKRAEVEECPPHTFALRQRMAIVRRIASGHVVLKLPLDIFSNPLAPKRNSSALIQDGPSSSFINASHSMDCFAVRIPPAGLKPTAMPVSCAYSRIARVITKPTGNVAFVGSFPVEVLMKSAPAIMATKLARATLRSVSRSPVAENDFHVRRARWPV